MNRHFLQPKLVRLCIVLLTALTSNTGQADVLTALNSARQHGCSDMAIGKLQLNRKLNNAARQYSKGYRPNDAAHAQGYEMMQLASLHLEGFSNDMELQSLLAQRSCSIVGDADARDVGYFQRGSAVWILIGTARGDPGKPAVASKQVLMLVNKARALARRCGNESFTATTALKLNELLTDAAQHHASDMAKYHYLDHEGHDGSTHAQRVSRTGYQWKIVGENIAGGVGTAQDVVDGWLDSPHHCANIMDPKYTEMGVAFAINDGDDKYGIYWAQEFAAPKTAKK